MVTPTLREKCPNMDFFSGLYFPAFGLNTEISVFSENAGKCGPEKTPYLDTFHVVLVICNIRYFRRYHAEAIVYCTSKDHFC